MLFSVMFRISVISLDRIESLAGAGSYYNRARLYRFLLVLDLDLSSVSDLHNEMHAGSGFAWTYADPDPAG